MARVDDTPAHQFERDKPIKYEERDVKKINLGKDEDPQVILVGDDWNPVLDHSYDVRQSRECLSYLYDVQSTKKGDW